MKDKDAWWAFEADLVSDLKESGNSQRRALGLLGISRGSWHARTNPPPERVEPVVPQSQRRSARWLPSEAVEQILGMLLVAFSAGKSVFQAYYEALDAGSPVASQASWYRIARKHADQQRPVRRRRRRRATAMPQWDATGPMQVWCWDVTKLLGHDTFTWYSFYVVIDAFSRKIVGWRVEPDEAEDLAKEMFETAVAAHGGKAPRIVHSDRGSVMTSNTLTKFFTQLGIEISKNRPRVSNDNPFAETWFKTAKYFPTTPAFFTSIDHARQWAAEFVAIYNNHHRHSSLEGHTPGSVHDGTWVEVHHARTATLERLREANPERYPDPVRIKTPYAHVTLNTPHDNTEPKDRLRTG